MKWSEPGAIELCIPSKLGYEKIAMTTAGAVAQVMGFSEDRIEDLKTAVAEACINSMEHGNKLDESLNVGVILSMTPDALEVKVRDHGPGSTGEFSIPDIDSKMRGAESARGMGMFLIHSLVDEVEWTSSPQQGGCARFVIHLHKPKED